MKLVVVSSLLTSLAQGISSPQTENCPLAVSSPFKFRWKENYARKKIASYKPVRSKLLKKLQKLGQVPDFANNGWTMLLRVDSMKKIFFRKILRFKIWVQKLFTNPKISKKKFRKNFFSKTQPHQNEKIDF